MALVRELSRMAASTWIGFMLTAILHTQVPIKEPSLIWIITTAAVWALSLHRPALQDAGERDA